MSKIERFDVNEDWAHSGIIKAGDFYFLSYCVGNIGQSIEAQINGAIDQMENRLKLVGLSLEDIVQMDCLFRDVGTFLQWKKLLGNASMESTR